MTTLSETPTDDVGMTRQRSRHIPFGRTVWVSSRREPPATATITWGVDAHDTTIIDLTGELWTATVDRVGKLVDEVADVSPADVAIDMSAVTFIDARGLSLLVLTRNRLAERGLRCRIVNAAPVVRRLFDIVGLA
jgi:anti-anti-sigma factor